MDDRGEKIVNLAREMLRSDFSFSQTKQSDGNGLTSSLKAACVAALLAAFGSMGVSHMIHEARRPLNRYERVELDALIFYAGQMNAYSEDDLRTEMLEWLARSNMNEMTYTDYGKARTYLQKKLR